MTAPAGYAAALSGAALFNVEHEAVLAVEGRDAAKFLHGQCSADINGLPAGEGRRGYILDVKAHPFGELFVYRDGERYLAAGWEPASRALFARLDRYLLGDRCTLAEISASHLLLHLAGPDAAALAAAIPPATALRWPRRRAPVAGVDWLVPVERAGALRADLLAAGAVAGEGSALEILRVEAGLPRGAGETDENTILPEWNQEDAVSYRKGCYIGQEIMERVRSRGAARRRLAGVRFAAGAAPSAGPLAEGGGDAGVLFTPLASPRHGLIALALIRGEIPDGAEVARDGAAGTVVKLPFS